MQLKDAGFLPVNQGNAGVGQSGMCGNQRLEMKTRVYADQRFPYARRNIQLSPDSLLCASEDHLAPGMIAVQPLCYGQDSFQIVTQDLMIAIALCFAQRLFYQVLDQNRLFSMRFVLRSVRLEIKTDGASGRGFNLRKLTNLFTSNHASCLLLW